MKNTQKRQYNKYPPKLIKSLDFFGFDEIAMEALKNKDYEGFKTLVERRLEGHKADGMFCATLVQDIGNNLDVKALKILEDLDVLKYRSRDINKIVENLKSEEDESIHPYPMYKQLKAEVYKILLPLKQELNLEELEILNQVMEAEEFKSFCEAKNIDLSSSEYENLSTNFVPKEPLITSVNDKCANPIETILTRTFSNTTKTEEIREAYKLLYDLDKASKEHLDFLAMKIAQGDSIRIAVINDSKFSSNYDPCSNLVTIGADAFNNEVFTLPEVLIHEIGHYFASNVFYKEMHHNLFLTLMQSFKEAYKSYSPEKLLPLKEQLETLIEIGKAARAPIDKATEIIKDPGFHYEKISTNMTEYFFELEALQYHFLENPIISALTLNFYDKVASKNAEEEEKGEWLKGSPKVLINLFDAYLDYNGEETISEDDYSPAALTSWTLSTFLPAKIKELKLTEDQIHFLGRMGDHARYDYDEAVEEMIVRYLEFKAAGIDQDLLDSFEGIVDIYDKYVSPIVNEQLNAYYAGCGGDTIEQQYHSTLNHDEL